jgi:hypothetical protein
MMVNRYLITLESCVKDSGNSYLLSACINSNYYKLQVSDGNRKSPNWNTVGEYDYIGDAYQAYQNAA